MERYILIVLVLLITACTSETNLSESILSRSRQNIFINNSLVCLYMNDEWGDDCNIIVFNKNGKLIDSKKCPSDPIPVLSYKDGLLLKVTYNVSKNNKSICKILEAHPLSLKGFIIESEVLYNYNGNTKGNTYYFDKFEICKEENNISFFQKDSTVIKLSTSNIYSSYGKLEFRERKNGLFVYHRLISENVELNDIYQKIIIALEY